MCQASFLPKQHKKSKTRLAIRGNWERNRRPNKEGRRRRPRRQRPQAAKGLACPPLRLSSRELFTRQALRAAAIQLDSQSTQRLAPRRWRTGWSACPRVMCANRVTSTPRLAGHWRSPFETSACHPGAPRVIGGVAGQGRCEHARSNESCGVGVRNGRQFCISRNALFQGAPPQMAQNRRFDTKPQRQTTTFGTNLSGPTGWRRNTNSLDALAIRKCLRNNWSDSGRDHGHIWGSNLRKFRGA